REELRACAHPAVCGLRLDWRTTRPAPVRWSNCSRKEPRHLRGLWLRWKAICDCGACGCERPDLRRRIANLAEDLLGMLAQHGCGAVDCRPVVVEENGIAGCAHSSQPRMIDFPNHVAGDDLRMLENFLEIVDGGAWHAGGAQGGLQFRGIARAHRRL